MKVAEAQKQQMALKGLVRAFEDAFVRTSASTTHIDFDPVLVIDMRSGMFQAFILSLRSDGNLYSIPRTIKVEEAEQISAVRARTPLSVYRKKKSQNWVVCSAGRLEQKAGEEDFEAVQNALEYVLSLSDKERASTFERLWFAFLSLLTETDSGQDYKRIVFVVDQAELVSLFQASLPKVGGRLDKGGSKWQSAFVVCIDHAVDLRGYAFLSNPRDLLASNALYLLLLNSREALEMTFNGSDFQAAPAQSVKLERFNKTAAVGLTGTASQSDLLLYADEDEFKTACLIGYLHWWLQIDDKRLDILRQKYTQLQEQLIKLKAETGVMQGLLSRLQGVLHNLNRL